MNRQQQGMAVLTVLLLITLMTLLAVTSGDRFQQGMRLAESGRFALQSAWSLRGAENWLLHPPLPQPTGEVQQLQLEQSLIHYQWRDRQACFNLNALGGKNSAAAAEPPPELPSRSLPPDTAPAEGGRADNSRQQVAQQLFLRLLHNLGVAEAQAQQTLNTLSEQISRGDFDEISQLREPASAVDPLLWQQLAPLICTLPSRQLQININGITDSQLPLFSALFDGRLSPAQAGVLLQKRPDKGWQTLAELLADRGTGHEDGNNALLLSVATTKTRAWELLMWTEDGQHSNSLRSRIVMHDEQLQVTDRLYGLSE